MPINPTSSQISSTVAVSSAQGNPILEGYIFASGILKPEHSNYLSYRYPQFLLTALLERIGRYKPVAQDTWSWSEMDRTRKSATVSSITTTLPAASVVLTTNIAASATTGGYFVVTDVVRTPTGTLLKVDATGTSGGFQTLTVSKLVDPTANITSSDLAASDILGHAFNAQPENSSAPTGRLYLPNQMDNKICTLRRSITISGSAFTDRTYLGDGKSWFFTQESIEDQEFARDREIAILLGQKSTGATVTQQCGDGLLAFINASGQISNFTGTVAETDLQNHIRNLTVASTSKEYVVLCGADFMNGVQKALRPYAIQGGIDYGTIGKADTAGFDFQTYKYMGVTVHFTQYLLFDDTAVFPYTSTSSSTKQNYSNFSLWLNMGQDSSGENLIHLKYKELDGIQRKLIKAVEPGLVSPGKAGGIVSNGTDGFKIHLLSDIGIEVRCANRHGILKANG